jgi:hypothetical protein
MASLKSLRVSVKEGAKATGETVKSFTSTPVYKMERDELEQLYQTYATLWRNQQAKKLAELVELKAEAAALNEVCTRCAGTGKYQFSNGRTGVCYRCVGKRHQTTDDVARNACYDKHNA